MTTKNLPFHVDKVETLLVMPSEPTPSHTLSLSSIDRNPFLYNYCDAIYVYRANDNAKCDPARLIQESLSKILVYYPPMAGKLKRNDNGELEVHCTGSGVPFATAVADCTLESLHYFDGIETEVAKQFFYKVEKNEKDGTHPLGFQVTKFACGGFTIGMSIFHSIADGTGAAVLFRVLTEVASGATECPLEPVWERERLTSKGSNKEHIQPPTSCDTYAISPYSMTDLVHGWFNVTSDFIKRLKIKLIKEIGDSSVSLTTTEVLGAFVWRSWFRSLEFNLDGKTNLRMAVGIRHVLDPPLPDGYYGNAIVTTNLALTGKDLSEGPLSRVVMMIKDSKRDACTIEYINSRLRYFESTNEHRRDGASITLTDWRRLGLLEQVDFGWKEAVNMIPIPWTTIEACYFLPPCSLDPSMEGGVKVVVCLPPVAMEKFKQEMDNL